MSSVYRLIRTDSTMINPTDEHNQPNSPIGEIIMSPRKRNSIIGSLCKEIKLRFKPIPPISKTNNIKFDTYLGATKLMQNKLNLIVY